MANIEWVYYFKEHGAADWDKSIATVRTEPLTPCQLEQLTNAIEKAGREYAGMIKVDLSHAPNFAGTINI